MPDGSTAVARPDQGKFVDSRYSWVRLIAALAISTLGGVGMWSVVVVLPSVQADFNATRADVSLAYTLNMLGFGFGGILMGRFVDRFGIFKPLLAATVTLALGYVASAYATTLWQFSVAHGLLIGLLGGSISFSPMIADTSLWFEKRRGLAVAICASGSYLAGTIWPPLVQVLIASYGWRITHVLVGVVCLVAILPLTLLLRPRSPTVAADAGIPVAWTPRVSLPVSPLALQALMAFAGFSCCVAMAMPQVHIVAYCGDLGYGVARGAEMLSLMLGFGIVSRLLSGHIADRIGGLATAFIGSSMQALALALYIPFDGLMSLYVISAFFGLVQGGIIPAYALIIREFFSPREAGVRIGVVLTSTMIGMAFGGWVSGLIFDWTASYGAAFINGIIWNLLNLLVLGWLMLKVRGRRGVVLQPA